MAKIRVSALQFATGTDVAENLQTCLRIIDQAASHSPDLMVMPEFCNHISWYEDASEAWTVALEADGHFLQAIAARAKQHRCHIVVNVTLRRSPTSQGAITVTSILYGRDGSKLLEADKQTLMGHENEFFVRAQKVSAVVQTDIANLGIFPCRDGVTCETPRALALRGAQIFCDSLNSFALDEALLHVPARAPENKVFLVAANKVGALVPEAMLGIVGAAINIPPKYLYGAGGSQIVAPDGRVLARAPTRGEAVVVADIEVDDANDKTRPDGSHVFTNRRPELYAPLASKPLGPYTDHAAKQIEVVCYEPSRPTNRTALGPGNGNGSVASDANDVISQVCDVVRGLDHQVRLLVLPELFCFNDGIMGDAADAVRVSNTAVEQLSKACAGRDSFHIGTSLTLADDANVQHCAVLINETGITFSQPQLHQTVRHAWSELGTQLRVTDLPWGRVAMLCGDDACYPEIVKVAALAGVHALIVPFDIQEAWEAEYGLLSRSSENRICVIACSRQRPVGAGLIASLQRDFTIMTEWQERVFDGNINYPIMTRQVGAITRATIHPDAASNKLMSENTDLLQHRPWHLCADLIDGSV